MSKEIVTFLIILILTISLLIIPITEHIKDNKLVVFDTLREYSYSNNFILEKSNIINIYWGMFLSNSLIHIISGMDLFYTFNLFGFFFIFLSGIFFYLICRNITKKRYLSITFLFLFFIGTEILSSAFYYRPQTIALFLHMVFLYLLINAYRSIEWEKYFFLTLFISIFSVNVHKTTMSFPIIFILFWSFYGINRKLKFKEYFLQVIIALIFLLSTIPSYVTFFDFYLYHGKNIDSSAFNQGFIPLSNFFNAFGYFLIPLTLLLIFHFISKLLDKNSNKFTNQDPTLLFSLFFFLIYFSLGYILPNLGLISINITRFDFFIYPFILLISLSVLEILFNKKGINKKILISLIIFSLIIHYIPPGLGETQKYTAEKSYIDEIKNLDINKGDLMITTFTATAAIQTGLDLKKEIGRYDYSIISGYHDWGASLSIIKSTRELFYSKNEDELIRSLNILIKKEGERLSDLPDFPRLSLPTDEEKNKIKEILDNPNRILIIIPIYDQNIRDTEKLGDENVIKWWKYREIPNIDSEKLASFKNLDIFYSSDNLMILEVKSGNSNKNDI